MSTTPNPMWGRPTRLSVYPTHCADAAGAEPFDRWNASAVQLRERLAMTERALVDASALLMSVACQPGDAVTARLRESLRAGALRGYAVLESGQPKQVRPEVQTS